MSHEEQKLQYERDALASRTPWTRWQVRLAGSLYEESWADLDKEPRWLDLFEYRRKPACAMGYEFPPPETALPVIGKPFYVADPFKETGYTEMLWNGDPIEVRLLYRGLVHLNPEDAKAHAQAMVYASGGAF